MVVIAPQRRGEQPQAAAARGVREIARTARLEELARPSRDPRDPRDPRREIGLEVANGRLEGWGGCGGRTLGIYDSGWRFGSGWRFAVEIQGASLLLRLVQNGNVHEAIQHSSDEDPYGSVD